MMRVVYVAAVVVVGAAITPYALVPGFNSADIIWMLCPLAILAIGPRPSRRARAETPLFDQTTTGGDYTPSPARVPSTAPPAAPQHST